MNIDYHVSQLCELLTIPSISAQSDHMPDMQKGAEWLQKKLTQIGFTSTTFQTSGHPIIYAESPINSNSKPTILIYGHYDIQDPGDLSEWSSHPFKPEIRAGNIYARGVADDKGQLYTWIAAIEELKSQNKLPDISIKFVIEGEEEVGGSHLDEFIADNRALLTSDICVISDTHNLSEQKPLISYGLRGLVYTEITYTSLTHDVHSGIYGGNIINPAHALSVLISHFKNSKGEITIPGFYDEVRILTHDERAKLAQLPLSEDDIKKETGATYITGEKDFTLHERAGARPTLDINGIWSGYNGEGPKTIIPAKASAKISMRLVPYQTSTSIFEKFKNYVEALTPKGIDCTITLLSGGEPILIDTNSPFFRAAEKAYEKVFGKKPLYELSGGSIPVTATFKNVLSIDSILMGYGLPDDGLHSPNEKMSLTMFEKGIKTNCEFFKNISSIKSQSLFQNSP